MHACMYVTANVLIDQSEAFNSLRQESVARNIKECPKLVSELPYQ